MTPPDKPEETEIEVLIRKERENLNSFIEVLIRKDRENMNSFVKNLNQGVRFDDLDVDLQAWWMNRY